MRFTSRRGAALLVVVVVMGVLAVLAAAAISFTGKERETAHHFTRGEEVRACADAARAELLARLRVAGVRPTAIEFTGTLPDSQDQASTYASGHYASAAAAADGGVTVDDVELVVRGVGGSQDQSRDVANVIAPSSSGGGYYSIAVHCNSRGRRHEIEMLVRFGI